MERQHRRSGFRVAPPRAPWTRSRGAVISLVLSSLVCGCGNDVTDAPAITISGQITDATGTPIEGVHINFVYEFVAAAASGNAAQQSASGGLTLFPNPFERTTTLLFEVEGAAAAMLDMFDANENPVRSLVLTSRLPAGRHSVIWDGRDEGQRQLRNGLYHARLVLGAPATSVETVRAFRNEIDGGSFAETWVTRTDADGKFAIPRSTLPVGASFMGTDTQGAPGALQVVDDMVRLWATLPASSPVHRSTRISVAQNVFVQLQFP